MNLSALLDADKRRQILHENKQEIETADTTFCLWANLRDHFTFTTIITFRIEFTPLHCRLPELFARFAHGDS
jgi:hypothetical protein